MSIVSNRSVRSSNLNNNTTLSRGAFLPLSHTRSSSYPAHQTPFLDMPPRRRVLLLTLDAFSTLYRPRNPIFTQYLTLAQQCRLPLAPDLSQAQLEQQVSSNFKAAFKSTYASSPNYGRATGMKAEEWWDKVVRTTFSPLLHLDQNNQHHASSLSSTDIEDESVLLTDLSKRLYTHFSSSAGYVLFPDARRLFDRLRTLRHSISTSTNDPGAAAPAVPSIIVAVLTNSDPRVAPILRSLGLRVGSPLPTSPTAAIDQDVEPEEAEDGPNDIDFVLTSYEAGYEKPDPRIFEAAERMAASIARYHQHGGVEIEIKKLHVGDDYGKDVRGAEAVGGWEAVYLDRRGGEDAAGAVVGPANKTVGREFGLGERGKGKTIARLDEDGLWREIERFT